MRIEARHITAGYGPRDILHDISLKLLPGEFVALIGPNGSGKSTLLRVLSGVLAPRAGELFLDGQPIARMRARDIARKIAFVPQTEPALFEFTVREVVLMGRHAHLRGLAGETQEDYAAATRAMAATDTLHLADRPITALSGGEHHRVLIARALAQCAPILLLDEPTAHLDLTHQADVLGIVRHLVDREGVSVLVALHDLNLASEYCDRMLLLSAGRIVAEGSPEVVLKAETLAEVYGGPVHIGRSPTSGKPFLFPVSRMWDADSRPVRRIHVICGGGTGLAVLSSLQRWGYTVSAGVLNRLDSDEEAASALGIEHVVEAPFSPIGTAARTECRALIAHADAVVITDVPIGNGNLPNLELAAEAQKEGKPIYLLGETPMEQRDFTGGVAQALWQALVEGGAETLSNVEALEAALERRFGGVDST
ncbi:MAG TPA: heme ABC transporter ATP-binding protein [Chthonomonadales bacterium]|nr:heme ABC transporter ATP-binding protein [Chthonomonadales bacterium]